MHNVSSAMALWYSEAAEKAFCADAVAEFDAEEWSVG